MRPIPLRSERGFWHLIGLQMQGAFSDNLLKVLILQCAGLIYFGNEKAQSLYNGAVTALSPVAFMLFVCWAGFLADKFSKRTITLFTKLSEFIIMLLATFVFWLTFDSEGPTELTLWVGLGLVFVMFAQSAFFSPSKYGIIPELVVERRLAWANGLVGATTYLAIIIGSAAGAVVFKFLPKEQLPLAVAGLAGLAVVGWLIGLGIDRVAPAQPSRTIDVNFLPELKRYWKIILGDRTLKLTVFGLAYFWGMGALLLAHVLVWGQHSLGMSTDAAGFILVGVALGIGVGSGLAGAISAHRIETGLIPLGGIGMALFSLPLCLATPDSKVVMLVSLGLVALFAGFFSVPLNAILQARATPKDRGGIIAAENYATNAAVLLSSGLYIGMTQAGVSPNGVFLVVAIATMLATYVVVKLMPDALIRMVLMSLTRTIYRLRRGGVENIPAAGPVLLVANHVSFVDVLLLQAACPRPIRYLAHTGVFKWIPPVRLVLRLSGAIPIGSEMGPRAMLKSLDRAAEALANGEVVCVFAEGGLTRTGVMKPFQRGYEHILKKTPAPVVPAALYGVWGSIFSFAGGRFVWKWPKRIPYPVHVSFGKPLAATPTPTALRRAIMELTAEAALEGVRDAEPLGRLLIRGARMYPFKFALVDSLSEPMNHFKKLVGSIVMARRLRGRWGRRETVGIMLPPSVGGALVNYAAALSGRTTVNLNYTLGQATLASCVEQAGVDTVVSARKFLDKVNLEAPAELIEITELRGKPGVLEIAGAVLAAALFPARLIERYCGAVKTPDPRDPATIIFSSGSTGDPKGVVLSHFNVGANVKSFIEGFRFTHEDRLLGVLPFFHSFGYTVAMWGSAIAPFGQVLHFSPIDIKKVGEMMERHGVTILILTPTFLQQYLRRMPLEQLKVADTIVTGAERLPEKLREACLEKTGIEPLQGYGVTEAAPAISVNFSASRSPGGDLEMHKRASVGHPIPGVAIEIRDPDTGQPVDAGQPGLIWTKGPNVMGGYLNQPEKTAEVLRDGWYNTGDMGYMDEDGFIFITGRLSRFSKIGGEMVPHGKVEETLHEVLGLSEEEGLAVTSVVDEAKGERLVVLHTLDEERLEGVTDKLRAAGLPNLFIPASGKYFKVDELPLLGTGKLDLRGLKRLAEELTGK